MAQGLVDRIVVGADRIAANGDTANKIGTYTVAVLAHRHGVPFYVAAPLSTIDRATPNGAAIPIEERQAGEVTEVFGTRVAPDETHGAQLRLRRDAAELITRDHHRGRRAGAAVRRRASPRRSRRAQSIDCLIWTLEEGMVEVVGVEPTSEKRVRELLRA